MPKETARFEVGEIVVTRLGLAVVTHAGNTPIDCGVYTVDSPVWGHAVMFEFELQKAEPVTVAIYHANLPTR